MLCWLLASAPQLGIKEEAAPKPKGMWLGGQALCPCLKGSGNQNHFLIPRVHWEQTPEPRDRWGGLQVSKGTGLVPAPGSDTALIMAMLTLPMLSLPEDLLHTRQLRIELPGGTVPRGEPPLVLSPSETQV